MRILLSVQHVQLDMAWIQATPVQLAPSQTVITVQLITKCVQGVVGGWPWPLLNNVATLDWQIVKSARQMARLVSNVMMDMGLFQVPAHNAHKTELGTIVWTVMEMLQFANNA